MSVVSEVQVGVLVESDNSVVQGSLMAHSV